MRGEEYEEYEEGEERKEVRNRKRNYKRDERWKTYALKGIRFYQPYYKI